MVPSAEHEPSLEERARALDAADVLAPCRERFSLPDGEIYLDGNSLGALPATAADHLAEAVTGAWGKGLVGSWNEAGWYEMPLTLGDRLAPILGAAAGQIAICDTTTLNLHKALSAAFGLRPERRTVVMEGADFPANLYVVEGWLESRGHGRRRRLLERDEDPTAALDDDVAVLILTQVNYRSGALWDILEVTRAAHEAGAVVIWDLCHSAGVVPLELDRWQVDFAIGCSYKYLNGGPGAPAWIYVADRHLGTARQPLTGWMGHANPFAFEPAYRPDPGIRGFLCGTPHILSLYGVEAGLGTFEGVEIGAARAKAMTLTSLFLDAVEELLPDAGLDLASPRDAARRGAQVSFAFRHGYAVVQAMIERGVTGDFRAPDVMRFGFAPLYVSHADAVRAARVMAACVEDEVWKEPRFAQRSVVT